ncbi:hypothetical protein CVD28_03845 [Bacillus sp. M6-12]|uniref:hypothetical protein n=1 Tax=Bacillus sp. M6-12 TaxID=2054166 RepID=UPI000C788AD6|nr:hypothetical protein [Bacillus sp. M6-12]PLS19560.1 hypothetical protein CVD28_03845 [Bacillus sp. M6-12]
MKFGQMSLPRLSDQADYIQLDICGLNAKESVDRYLAYKTNLPVILHGDWEKKGNSENNIGSRLVDYVDIINGLRQQTEIIGFTMHPTFRKKVPFEEFLFFCDELTKDTGVPVFIENRSNQKIWLSTPEEIIDFSHKHDMTIDLPQLFISCQFNEELFVETLKKIHWINVKELHMANIKRQAPRTFVARKVEDGELKIHNIISIFESVPYCTIEILGGVPTFDSQVEILKSYK